MTNTANFNQFTYVIEANQDTKNELITWVIKSQEYISQYFGGDRSRIRKTTFGDCVAKVEALVDLAFDDNYASDFRGVRDVNGRLQAGAIISRQIGIVFPYTEERVYLSIDPFTTPPWNCLSLEGAELREKIKGAARWLMSEIVQEILDTEIEGVTKVLAVDRAKNFYLNIEFQENPEYPPELILTKEAAITFLQNESNRRG
jgi:hypothetical protein